MPILGFNEAGDNGQAACLARAFANLNLFCSANNMKIYSIRGFTVANMHAARNAFPWLGCKGADSITILKWIRFYAGLQLQQNGWSLTEKKVLEWMLSCSRAGLSFSQGIHGHGIWMGPSCVSHCRSAVQRFGNSYAYLADYCLKQGYCLYGMVPKLHSYMHFRTDFDDSLKEGRENTLNPAVFDNSMSEDFVGRISRQSRRVPFKRIEWTILRCYMVKAKLQIKRVCKLGKRRCVRKKSEAWTE